MFIQTEETPNPATLKFLPGRIVMPQGTADFPTAESAQSCPLADALFCVSGVAGVFLGHDFITITKVDTFDWLVMKPALLGRIMEYFLINEVVTFTTPRAERTAADIAGMSAIEAEICDLLETRIRPAVAMDGGDIDFDRFEDGVVYLHLKGACAGCPSSSQTLKSGIETMLKHYIPEVLEVRAA